MFTFIDLIFLQKSLTIFIILFNSLATVFTIKVILREKRKRRLPLFIFILGSFAILFYISINIVLLLEPNLYSLL